ncbi:MAG: phosphatidylserine/phosphatidylglycerophosphate/cardiolipin synthase family protein [Deltaproteobacteria bacterium]|nr:phosphatidylserine/phosphatidylglycerophosphate/cardiolipin synthase family protein [Deltaproteobacteria bacterium]
MIRKIILIILPVSLSLFFSCGTGLKKREYKENISFLNTQRTEAAILGNNEIQIRYQHGERTGYIYASWNDPAHKDNEYYHCLAEICFSKISLKTGKDARRIPVLGSDKWEALLDRVKKLLAPKAQGEGASIILNYQELVLYRDTDNKIYLKKTRNVPSYIKIIGLLKEDVIASETVKLLKKETAPDDTGNMHFLFRTNNIYHGGIVFVFIDINRKQCIFLTTPYNPEFTHDTGIHPAMYTARWFYRSGVLTTVKNPVTTMYRLYRRLWHSVSVILTGSETLDKKPSLAGPETQVMNMDDWENRLDRMFPNSKAFKGRVKFLIDGDDFFPRLEQRLREADKSIWLRTYIFDNDDYAVKIADILKIKSQDVRVRVLADHMGCMSAAKSLPSSPIPPDFRFPSDIFDYLKKDSKIKIRTTTNPWFTADHNKSIIIDSNTAFIGGMNIGREYRYEWHDMMMEINGPIVGRIKKDFLRAWTHAGPFGDVAYLFSMASSTKTEPDEELPNLYNIRPLYTKAGSTQIFDAQLEAIKNARKYIYLQNPYFTENKIINELILARSRGVDVRVILPSTSDYGFMDSSNIVTTNIMIKNGIRVYHYPKISHIKAAIYDGWACLGSANFDALSLRINLETNLAFSDPEAVETLRTELFEKDFSVSKEIIDPIKVTFLDYLGEMISNQL